MIRGLFDLWLARIPSDKGAKCKSPGQRPGYGYIRLKALKVRNRRCRPEIAVTRCPPKYFAPSALRTFNWSYPGRWPRLSHFAAFGAGPEVFTMGSRQVESYPLPTRVIGRVTIEERGSKVSAPHGLVFRLLAFTSVKTIVKAKPAPAIAASRKKIIAKPG